MESKKIKFHIYRYHLLPIDNNHPVLFETRQLDINELKARKNEILGNVLELLPSSKKSANPLKLENKDGNNYLFKISQKKTTKVYVDFEPKKIPSEPYSYVIINNDPLVQKIAISDTPDAFSTPDVVKKILLTILRRDLGVIGLNINIEPLFDSINFWKTVAKHKDGITNLKFRFVRPNLGNISKTLGDDLKVLVAEINSHDSEISFKAPKKGVLQNIDQSNKQINGLVSYSSEGGGNISLKVSGIRKTLNTKENPLTLEIEECHIEGSSAEVIKMYKSIVE